MSIVNKGFDRPLSRQIRYNLFIPLYGEDVVDVLGEIEKTSKVVVQTDTYGCRVIVSDRYIEVSALREVFEAFEVEDAAAFLCVDIGSYVFSSWIEPNIFNKVNTVVSSLMDRYELFRVRNPFEAGSFRFYAKDGDKYNSLISAIQNELGGNMLMDRVRGETISY